MDASLLLSKSIRNRLLELNSSSHATIVSACKYFLQILIAGYSNLSLGFIYIFIYYKFNELMN
jgi:hypothetical protein